MSDVKTIFRILPSLTPEEVRQVETRCRALLKSVQPTAREQQSKVQTGWLFQGYEHVFKAKFGISLNSKERRAFVDGEGLKIEAWLEKKIGRMSEVQKLQMGRTLAMLHVKHLESRAINMQMENPTKYISPVTPSWCFNTLRELPAIIDNGFPGYLDNGILLAIVTGTFERFERKKTRVRLSDLENA
jgi:hypothetical protein